jgi:hypothetical protein
MFAQKDRHISLTTISDILWDNLCIERSEKSIENRGIESFKIGQVVIGEIAPRDACKKGTNVLLKRGYISC